MKIEWLKKPLPAALLLVFLWTVWRLVLLWHTGIPQPAAHDEFGYLLGADTFAHGRLANPALPLGKFFESPHIFVRPVYASKFPPGQSLFLALGQVVFGSPFSGVIIGCALMLFTVCLMLYAWVPAQWALAVTAMFGLMLSPSMYWANSYWGGAVAASGGALVLLGVGMYRAKQTPLAGVNFAIGVLLLFFTRPFEGGVFTLLVLIVFGKELWRKRRAGTLAAAALVLAIGGAWTCLDNEAITGNPFLLPHELHAREYQVQPVFWFQPLRPQPTYSNPRLAALHGTNGWEAGMYRGAQKGWKLVAARLIGPLGTLRWDFGIAMLLMLLVPVAWGDPLYRKMAIVFGVFLLALGAETFHQEHYTAPVLAALALMMAIWAERAWKLRFRNVPVGAALVVLALVSPVIAALPQVETAAKNFQLDEHFTRFASSENYWSNRRGALIARVSALDRPQLVIVRYPWPSWHITEEWVYNSADIDHQRVVFAHDFGTEQNRALLNHYPDRTALLLTFDPVSGQEHIEPYPSASSQP
ncbi:MAG: hypothetical protein WAM85_14000 [Terracidiphilus sp.]